jgi:hypothetical protein
LYRLHLSTSSMSGIWILFCALAVLGSVSAVAAVESSDRLDTDSLEVLSAPVLSKGKPAAGRLVAITAPEYVGTGVFHTLYLPNSWKKGGERLPLIFEYTGNYFPKSGSTGEVEGAGLGYGLSGGQFIWVSLPYVSEDGRDNEVTWWGDEDATVEYAKVNVPRIIEEYGADSKAVFLCGFSRGAIGVNYLGLHDDEVAKLWTAFITHDHFDGVKEWGITSWGSPLDKYRAGAAERLKRVEGRPYLVCQNGDKYGSEVFVRSVLGSANNFTFNNLSTSEIFGSFPHPLAKAAHTDFWAYLPSKYRTRAWEWMNTVLDRSE